MSSNLTDGNLTTIVVATAEELQTRMNQYLAEGFLVTSQTADMVTLNRTPPMVWAMGEQLRAILLTFLCIVPGLLYMRDTYKRHRIVENVVIRIDPDAAAAV